MPDNGGCYIVPAFSGLFAPHWRSEARGVIVGLTSYITTGHLARAVLEATGWQTREVVDAMNADSGIALTALKVDGGMTANHLLMQFVADVLDVPVVRPMVTEAVSLGAAYAAGLAVGYWSDLEGLRSNWHRAGQWLPHMDATTRSREYANWRPRSSAPSTGSAGTDGCRPISDQLSVSCRPLPGAPGRPPAPPAGPVGGLVVGLVLGGTLRLHPAAVVRHLALDLLLVPAEHRGHQPAAASAA